MTTQTFRWKLYHIVCSFIITALFGVFLYTGVDNHTKKAGLRYKQENYISPNAQAHLENGGWNYFIEEQALSFVIPFAAYVIASAWRKFTRSDFYVKHQYLFPMPSYDWIFFIAIVVVVFGKEICRYKDICFGPAMIQASDSFPLALFAERWGHVVYFTLDMIQIALMDDASWNDAVFSLNVLILGWGGFLESTMHEFTAHGYTIWGTDSVAEETIFFGVLRQYLLANLYMYYGMSTVSKRFRNAPCSCFFYYVVRNITGISATLVGWNGYYWSGYEAHFYGPQSTLEQIQQQIFNKWTNEAVNYCDLPNYCHQMFYENDWEHWIHSRLAHVQLYPFASSRSDFWEYFG